jgi:hypothetical protein
VGELIELPDGPSGRKPRAAIRLAYRGLNFPNSFLVLFKDGAMGTWADRETASPLNKPPKSFDGSEYGMIFHSLDQLGKIEQAEEGKRSSNWESAYIGLSSVICVLYLGLFIYVRANSEWPDFLSSIGDYFGALLFGSPLLIYSLPRGIFDFSPGDIVIYPVNTDPHYYPINSYKIDTISNIAGFALALTVGCFFSITGPEPLVDASLVLLFLMVTISHFTDRPMERLLSFGNKDESYTQVLRLNGFLEEVNVLHSQVRQQKRMENPLLNLLMDNESPTLEFKGSLWASYHGVTGEPVAEQKDKNDNLEDAVLKTVAAFLNTSGGTLLIGIKDKPRDSGDQVAEVLGIEPDFRWLKKGKQDTEGYEHFLIEIFNKSLSNPVASQYITISFPVYESKIICRIDVEPLPRRVGQQCFTTTKTMGGQKLFVRSGDSTIPQSRETEYDYIRHHFEGFSGKNNES